MIRPRPYYPFDLIRVSLTGLLVIVIRFDFENQIAADLSTIYHTTLTPTNGSLHRVGKLVIFNYKYDGTNPTSYTIPVGYRPIEEVLVGIGGNSGNWYASAGFCGYVGADGSISGLMFKALGQSAPASTDINQVCLYGSWITNDATPVGDELQITN